MVAAWWSNLMPQNYATRTGEASCELPESQQGPPEPPRASLDKELLPSKDSARKQGIRSTGSYRKLS